MALAPPPLEFGGNNRQYITKVPSLKEVNFGKVKLWAVEHFWTDFDLIKRRDKKMDQISD